MSSVAAFCAGNDFHDRVEAVLLVARIDALRRIADVEIGSPLSDLTRLEDRHALLLDRARIDRRFIDDDVALLERAREDAMRRIIAPRSGRCASSIGVGTVTMKKSEVWMPPASLVKIRKDA